MHLPEPVGRHPPVPPDGVLGQETLARHMPATAVRHHRALTRGWRDRDVDRPGTLPLLSRDADLGDSWMGDQAVTNPHDLMGPVLVQAGQAVLSDSEADPGAPAEPAGASRQRL